jgi:hypothetical protein
MCLIVAVLVMFVLALALGAAALFFLLGPESPFLL